MKRLALTLVLFVAAKAGAQTFTALATGGKSITTWHGQASGHSLVFEWSRPQTKTVDLGLAIEPRVLTQPRSWFGDDYGDGNERVRAIAASFVARKHFGSKSVRPYVEVLIGPMWAERQVPESTSRFNVVTQPGAGITFATNKRIEPVIGYRFVHISNGGYAPRNPGLNVHELIAGVRVK